MLSLGNKKTGTIGVQITPLQIRMVELSGTLSAPTVEHYWLEPLAPDIYNGSDVLDQPKLGEAIKAAYQKGKFSGKNISIALPAHLIISREFVLTAEDLSDPQEFVDKEAAANVPMDIEDCYLDYQVLDPVDSSNTAFTVAYAASKKQHVDEYVGAIEIAGLTPKVVDSDQNAMLHVLDAIALYQFDGSTESVMSVHIGHDQTKYMVIREGRIVWTHDQSGGLRNLQESISGMFGVELGDALSMALNPGAYAEEFPSLEADLVQPFVDGHAMDILRAVEQYNEQSTVLGVNHLWLSGEACGLPGLEDTVRDRSGIESVEVANPLGHCSLGSKIKAEALLEAAPVLMVAAGMAFRSFPQ